jgi:uncharacterized protein (TIGR02118 family)
MVVVSVLYPQKADLTFDMDYYTGKHLPLVRRLLEPAGMRSLSFYRPVPLAGDPPYHLVAELRFDDMHTTQSALAAHGAETQADIRNFSNADIVMLVGEETAA